MSSISPFPLKAKVYLRQIFANLSCREKENRTSTISFIKAVICGSTFLSIAACDGDMTNVSLVEATEPVLEQVIDDDENEAGSEEKRVSAPTTQPCNVDQNFNVAKNNFLDHISMNTMYLDRVNKNMIIDAPARSTHGSPYFRPGTPGHEEGMPPGSHLNGNYIDPAVFFRYVIPLCPKGAGRTTPTELGVIGVSVEGVPLYNQYAAGGLPIGLGELDTFDQWNGHPDPSGVYHHHKTPYFLTRVLHRNNNRILGYLLDGFPVYGPIENGRYVRNDELDAAHGHRHRTVDFGGPEGMYHYHFTDTFPYINGAGYRGTPGQAIRFAGPY
jgi:YHYH protein